MKKKILVTGLTACMLIALGSCNIGGTSEGAEEHNYVEHEAVAATCESAGNEAYYTCNDCDKIFDANKQEIAGIPTVEAKGHAYTLVEGKDGTCNAKGEIDRYECGDCDKVFDLSYKEITVIEGEMDSTNHASTAGLTIMSQPTKTLYKDGEAFDPTGMVAVYKCEGCEGEAISGQFLTFVYATEGATAFSVGDTKITVKFNNESVDIPVTVEKGQLEIIGVESTYATTCGVAPQIDARCSDVNCDVAIQYYDGDVEVDASAFIAGKTYTAKVSVAETEKAYGAETTATVTVNHSHDWTSDEEDWRKEWYACACGDVKDYYVMNYQSPYVDAENLAIDLSQFVCGAQSMTIKSVQQIVRMKDGVYVSAAEGNLVDIDYTNEGMQYTFAADKYERPSSEWKPYILTLAVTYDVDGVECVLVVEAKLVDKIITDAEDLKLLAYTGAADAFEEGAMFTYYVLGCDIDASGVEINQSNPCWAAAGGFRGVFDGNGYTISNLNVTGGQGLFGAIGENAKIQNVSFTNVKVAKDLYALAYCARNARFSNVSISFDKMSTVYAVANSMNACTFDNVSILGAVEQVPFLVDEDASLALPEGVSVSYHDYCVVSFDTDGGNAIASFAITSGKTLSADIIPTKTADEWLYVFQGWTVNGEAWDLSTAITENTTFVAVWEQIEKPAENVLSYAKLQTLTKWDYGQEITVTKGEDEEYGAVWKVAIAETAEQSIQNQPIDTTGYERVYFYVYNPCAYEVRLTIHGGYEGWGLKEIMLAQGWNKVELDASAFGYLPGQICMMLQDPNAVSVAGEWMITSFYGLKAGETAPEVETPEIPEEPTTNVLLDATKQTLVKWDYGQAIMVDKDTDESYGDFWKITVGETNEQGISHDWIDTSVYERVYFYVYNPCAYEVRLNIHGAETWAAHVEKLAAQCWTKVEVATSLFNELGAGKIFIVLQDPDANSVAGEWKVTSFYGLKAGETAPEVETPEIPEEPTTNVLLDATKQTLVKWDYGQAIMVDKDTDESYGDFWKITVGVTAEQGISHDWIDTSVYERVYFYVYNPCAYEVRLNIHGAETWAAHVEKLAAQCWTKVEVATSLFNELGAGKIFIVLQDPDANSVAGEWMITSFYGVKA